MQRRREFYKDSPTIRSSKVRQQQQQHRVIFSAEENFSISLEFCPDGKIWRPSGQCSRNSQEQAPERRYLLCPAGTTVALLKKFMKLKFVLPEEFKVDVFHANGPLLDQYSLMDIAYVYSWKREGVLQLYYSIYKMPDYKCPVITVTEVKDEIVEQIKDDVHQNDFQKLDDNRPSFLFNKATLLGNHSVDRHLHHDLSPLELIATVANDISCLQEGRGLKRKTEEFHVHRKDGNSAPSMETLKQAIEMSGDICSNTVSHGNQEAHINSLAVDSTSNESAVKSTSLQQLANSTKSLLTDSINISVNDSNNVVKLLDLASNAPPLGRKPLFKERPKKTDTASQCDPRPKKHKGDAQNNSSTQPKSSSKTQTLVQKTPNLSKRASSTLNNTNTKPVKSSNKKVMNEDKTENQNDASKHEDETSNGNSGNSIDQNGTDSPESVSKVGGHVKQHSNASDLKKSNESIEKDKEKKPLSAKAVTCPTKIIDTLKNELKKGGSVDAEDDKKAVTGKNAITTSVKTTEIAKSVNKINGHSNSTESHIRTPKQQSKSKTNEKLANT